MKTLKPITTEREILNECINSHEDLNTKITEIISKKIIDNPISENILGYYRNRSSRKAIIVDNDTLDNFREIKLKEPSFLEAGSRKELWFDPNCVRAAIVTTGGLAPGLHCVIHSIVKRHYTPYALGNNKGRIFGVRNSFQGLCNLADNMIELNPNMTEEWLDQGGCKLGIVRYYYEDDKSIKGIEKMVNKISENLRNNRIDILYVIGGDGSLKIAHEIALKNRERSIIGIPKTMDNDILWVWQSFGFDTAVQQATKIINTLKYEAEATRRICIIELFGAEAGFVAANATLASGHVDAVLIPEVFAKLNVNEVEDYINGIVDHINDKYNNEKRSGPYSVVVVAEGVGSILEFNEVVIDGVKVQRNTFVNQFKELIENRIVNGYGKKVSVFVNQPRHNIRAVPANSHDQIYCEQLGARAVDNALGGFTDCMVSQWLTEYVLVPLELVQKGQKSIPIKGMFWKQVINITEQPLSRGEKI